MHSHELHGSLFHRGKEGLGVLLLVLAEDLFGILDTCSQVVLLLARLAVKYRWIVGSGRKAIGERVG